MGNSLPYSSGMLAFCFKKMFAFSLLGIQIANMARPQGKHYPLMRELLARTTFSERSIRNWLSTETEPRNAYLRSAWTKALAAAQAKLAKAQGGAP